MEAMNQQIFIIYPPSNLLGLSSLMKPEYTYTDGLQDMTNSIPTLKGKNRSRIDSLIQLISHGKVTASKVHY